MSDVKGQKFINLNNLTTVLLGIKEKLKTELQNEGVNSINGITGTPIITGDNEYIDVSNKDKTISIVPTKKIKNAVFAAEEAGVTDADGKYHLVKSVNGKAVTATINETGIVVNNDIVIDAKDIKVAEEGNMYDENGYETIQEALDGIYDTMVSMGSNGVDKIFINNIEDVNNIQIGDLVVVDENITGLEDISVEWSTSAGDFVYTDLDFEKLTNGSEIETWLDENKTQTAAIDGPWYIDEDDNGKYVHCPLGNGQGFYYTRNVQGEITLLPKGTYIQTQVGLILIEQNLGNITGAIGDDYVEAKAIGANIQVTATDKVKNIIDSIENNSFDISAKNVKLEEGTDVNDAIDGINIKISELTDVSDDLIEKDMAIGTSINNIVDEISINKNQTQLSLNKKAIHHEITEQFFISNPLLKQEIKEGDTIHLQKTIYTTEVVSWVASGNALYTRGYVNDGQTEFLVHTHPNLNSESVIGTRWICGVDDSGTYIYDQYGDHDFGFTKFYENGLYKNTSYANLVQKAGFYIMAHKDGNSYKLIEQKNINISGDDYISVKEDGSNFKINFSNNLTAYDIDYDGATVMDILDTLIEENKPKYIEISSLVDLEEALNDENNIGYIFYVTNTPIASGIYIKTSKGLFKINGEFI